MTEVLAHSGPKEKPPNPLHQRELWGVTVLTTSHPAVRRLRKLAPKTSHHGNKLWKANTLLLDYLQEFPPARNSRVLEVGAGWGIAGIYCAKMFEAQVTALDIDQAVFPVLALQAEANQVAITPWMLPLEELTLESLKTFDVLIASDICFWDTSTQPVITLLKLAHDAGLRCIVSDPGRPPFIYAAEALADQLELYLENWSVPHPHNISGLILEIPVSAPRDAK